MSEDNRMFQDTIGMISEPAVGYELDEVVPEQEIDYNFNGVDFGYAGNLEELEAALNEADLERNDPSKWITPVEFHARLESKFQWLK